MLEVNKIHYILACEPDTSILIDEVRKWIESSPKEDGLNFFETYWNTWAIADEYDPAPIIFVKRMLQVGLPVHIREKLINNMFANIVTEDDKAFSEQLYMTKQQLRSLIRAGHYVGNHGWDHYWLNDLEPKDQASEIDQALGFLANIGAPTKDWVIAYPYGGWNKSLLTQLEERDCLCGMTTIETVANLRDDNRFLLPRLDTNQFSVTN